MNWGIVLTVKNFTNNQNKTAIIDVGSNSVRYALYPSDVLQKKEVATTRLAKDIKDGYLSKESIDRTTRAISDFYNKAKTAGVLDVKIFATAALRNAKNKEDFILALNKLCDGKVDIISGEQEAFLGALGALNGSDGGVIDVGGASTEVIVLNKGKVLFSKSINVGAVTLTEKFRSEKNNAKAYLKEIFSVFSDVDCKFFKTIGGTATTIASILLKLVDYDPNKVHGYDISIVELEKLVDNLYSLDLDARKNILGLRPERADVIPCGVLILTELLKILNVKRVTVSETDNMEGYYMLKGKING